MVDISHLNGINAYTQASNQGQLRGMSARDNVASNFGNIVQGAIQNVIEAQRHGENVSVQAIKGEASLVDVMEAINNAETSLNTFVTVRDRMISAYEKILQMPI